MTCLKLTVLLLMILYLSNNAHSQDIATDNEGSPIFSIPTNNKLSPQISLNNIGVTYTPFILQRSRFFIRGSNPKEYTMSKSWTVNLKANIINTEEDALLISGDMKLRPRFEVALNRTIDTLFKSSTLGSYYTFSAALITDYQKFEQYDLPAKKLIAPYKRWNVGGRVSLNIFQGTKSAWALNLTYKNSLVTDDLTSYHLKMTEGAYIDDNIIANGDADGYIGPLSPSKNIRFSIARPWFLKSVRAAIIPYYFLQAGEIKPKHNGGLMFTFLERQFRNFETTNNGDPYEFSTAFSIGANLLGIGSDKKQFVFVSGTISFGKTKGESKEKAVNADNKKAIF